MLNRVCVYSFVFALVFNCNEVAAETLDETVKVAKEALPDKRKAYIKKTLDLTPKQAKQFWPLYTEYSAEMSRINDQSYQLVNDYGYAYKHNEVTDMLAEKLMAKHFKIIPSKNKLLKNFCKNLSKVFSSKFAMRFLQAEERMDTIIEYTYQFDIPLIEFK